IVAVHHLESGYASEFPGVSCNERCAPRQRRSGCQRVERPDRLAAAFQRNAKFGRASADSRVERDYVDHGEKLLILSLAPLGIRRAQYAYPHLVGGNSG